MSSRLCLCALIALFLVILILYSLRASTNKRNQLKITQGNLQTGTLYDNKEFFPTSIVKRRPTINEIFLAGLTKNSKNFQDIMRDRQFEGDNHESKNIHNRFPLRKKKIQHLDNVILGDRFSFKNHNANRSWTSLKKVNDAGSVVVHPLKDGPALHNQKQENKDSVVLPDSTQVKQETHDLTDSELTEVNAMDATETSKENRESLEGIYDDRTLPTKQKVENIDKGLYSTTDNEKAGEPPRKQHSKSELRTFLRNAGNGTSDKRPEYITSKFDYYRNVKHHVEDTRIPKGITRINVTELVVELQQDSEIFYKEAFLNTSYLTFYRETKPQNNKNIRKFSVLLLHASKFTSTTWLAIGTMKTLAGLGFRTVAIDLPGFGNSKESKIPYSEHDSLRYMVSLLMHLKLGSCAVVAPSRSGDFAMPLLMHYPVMLQAFVAIAPTYTSKFRTKAYKNIRVPTLVIFGENDGTQIHLASLDNLEHLADRKIYMIKNATHPCYIDRPRTFHKLLISFLIRTEESLVSSSKILTS